MKTVNCVRCSKPHTSPWGWTYRDWGHTKGWGCRKKPYRFEFVTDAIKNERQKYLKSQIQSHRQGELSKEWVENYPQKAAQMVKDGALTSREVKKAKPVWPELGSPTKIAKTL